MAKSYWFLTPIISTRQVLIRFEFKRLRMSSLRNSGGLVLECMKNLRHARLDRVWVSELMEGMGWCLRFLNDFIASSWLWSSCPGSQGIGGVWGAWSWTVVGTLYSFHVAPQRVSQHFSGALRLYSAVLWSSAGSFCSSGKRGQMGFPPFRPLHMWFEAIVEHCRHSIGCITVRHCSLQISETPESVGRIGSQRKPWRYRYKNRPAPRAHAGWILFQMHVGLSDESILLASSVMPWLGTALEHLNSPDHFLLDLQYSHLVWHWKRALTGLGLPPDHCVLYQLRHAGPSHDRLHHLRSALEVKQRGRWASDSSTRRYEAHGRVNQEFYIPPEAVQETCVALEKKLQTVGLISFYPPTKVETKGIVIELFSGCARLSQACAAHGYISIAFDIEYGAERDLLRQAVVFRIKRFIWIFFSIYQVGLVWYTLHILKSSSTRWWRTSTSTWWLW